MTVYLLPGLGCDPSLFRDFEVKPFKAVLIDYPDVASGESLATYSQRLLTLIDTSEPFALVGVSMGGMVAMEMAQVTRPEKVVLISSASKRSDLPKRVRWWKLLPLYRWAPASLVKFLAPLSLPMMGAKGKVNRDHFRELLRRTGAPLLKESIRMVIEWEGPKEVIDHVAIHGDKDQMIPLKNRKGVKVLPQGTHLMVLNQRQQVQDWVLEQLQN